MIFVLDQHVRLYVCEKKNKNLFFNYQYKQYQYKAIYLESMLSSISMFGTEEGRMWYWMVPSYSG